MSIVFYLEKKKKTDSQTVGQLARRPTGWSSRLHLSYLHSTNVDTRAILENFTLLMEFPNLLKIPFYLLSRIPILYFEATYSGFPC